MKIAMPGRSLDSPAFPPLTTITEKDVIAPHSSETQLVRECYRFGIRVIHNISLNFSIPKRTIKAQEYISLFMQSTDSIPIGQESQIPILSILSTSNVNFKFCARRQLICLWRQATPIRMSLAVCTTHSTASQYHGRGLVAICSSVSSICPWSGYSIDIW